MALPALRTVRAVFPHTALQLVVSSSGVSRTPPSCVECEQPGLCEECTSFDAVLQRRHHAFRPDRSFHPRPSRTGFCTLCSPRGHCRCSLCSNHVLCASTFLPTFPRRGFAIRAFRRSSRLRYYAGSASCRALASPTGLSAYPALPSGHPVPNHVVRPNVALPVTSARPAGRGFATHEQARRNTPPNRVRHPTGCRFASGCSPPRLTATQLPSAT